MTETAQPTDAHILVVDDNEMNRELLVRRLERIGHTLDTADGGHAALERISLCDYDLVLLDINMPDLDGLAVLEKVRETKGQVELPIIMVSARDESESIADAINKGANDYITKPIDFPVAAARIRTHLDVSRAHTRLKESEERYALAFRGANDGLWDWDLRSGKIFYSDRWADMLGIEADALSDDPEEWFDRAHPDELEGLKHAIEDHLLGLSDALEHEYRALHADGSFRWLLTRGVASRGEDGQAIRISGSQTDVTRSKAYDPITSIPNKVLFMDRLEWLLDRERRHRQGCFAVLLVKIDRLKELRQTLGPVAAEHILMETANRLNETLRADDTTANLKESSSITISRHDEAEFAVLLEGCRDETSTPKVAERLGIIVNRPLEVGGEHIVLTSSIGIVTSSADDDEDFSANEIIAHAASALARARIKGGGHFELFDRHMQQRALSRLQLETDLRRAIASGQLSINYQPIVKLNTGKIAGCEALARWTHPVKGAISPVEFIPLAEECGLIDTIGEWVLEESCRQHQQWIKAGAEPIELSVNFSLLQMQRDGVEDRVLEILERTGMDPKLLKIEITESIFMEDMDRINSILTKLNDKGIGIAIDDYGTGYSSLAYLNRLPITHLKIDQSFVGDVSTDIAAQAIVQSTLLMAQSMGIEVVAEGIETLDQEALLQVFKAEYGQGYHFWRPITGDQLSDVLTSQ
ncbi:putative bifunctional diguanylate cyclase/phosphodiesterase [Pseudomonadota bacterium]